MQRVPKVKLRRGKDLPQPFLALLFKAIPWVKGEPQINWRYIQLATRRGRHHEVKGLSKWWVELCMKTYMLSEAQERIAFLP